MNSGLSTGLEEVLSLSLQFSRTRPPEKKRAIEALAGGARTVMEYIERFRGGLTDHVFNDLGYSYRVFLVPKTANRENTADAAVEFIHIDDADEEQRIQLDRLNVLIKDRQIPIANLDKKKPSEVVDAVRDPFRSSSTCTTTHQPGSITRYDRRVRMGSRSTQRRVTACTTALMATTYIRRRG